MGALLGGVGDIYLTYNAQVPGGVPYEWESIRELVRTIPHSDLLLGHYLGVLGMPLSMLGFWALYRGVRPAGRAWALPLLLLPAWLYYLGIAYHGQLALLGAAEAAAAGPETIARFHDAMWPLLTLQQVGLGALSVYFPLVILKRPTRFPRWFAAFSPGLIAGLVVGAAKLLPEPARMAMELSAFNLTALVILAASTALQWRSPAEQVG